MTKAELIRFLEPFDDDIRIVVDRYEYVSDAKPEYHVAKPTDDEEGLNLEAGEGYVEL